MRLGIDLGGTKIEVVVLADGGEERLRRRVPTPAGDYEATLAAIGRLIDEAEHDAGPATSIGIGTPGAPSRVDGRLRNANSTCLNGRPLKKHLETQLGRPVVLANDANCFALSEAMDGAGADAACLFGVILGTGVGGGIVINRQLLTGANAIAGEWGHNPLPWPAPEERPGPACYCGRRGCIETYLSGPGLARDHATHTGQELDAATLVARAADGDAACQGTLARYEERLARALAHVINILDPQVIVLGGGLSRVHRLYDTVPRLWGKYVFCDHVQTRLRPPHHGDASGVRGAAWLGAA